ncbi:PREDICTED: uncharacterized protein LOC104811108 [Tarenaya hassleriana]|uniref:uncharacterized protein LOC104811108 n=1 Tax=Tarenaya hassleriana TaxID=28532 RepID=UPI00053C4BEE|nr:PREDICTED: uncharacterized protein LOC104811108 [Tarenaya hassleriana]
MLDGLLGRGFVPKGKSLIKLTKNRIDVLRRKRTATIKFLKKDLADLLANGLDVNAYGRAGGLLDELKHLWNLDFVEMSSDFVYKHLSVMQKIGECPEDCREAVSSLMFAASAFSELPELRDLRQMFHEKYGESLELFVNQELVESLSTKPFSLEKKVKLMADVASEFSIPWDSKAFERMISRHNNATVKELNKIQVPPNISNDKYKFIDENKAPPIREMHDFSSKQRSEGVKDEHSLNRKKADASERTDPFSQPAKEFYQNDRRGDHNGLSSRERTEKVHHSARPDNKDNEAERNGFGYQSRLKPSRERHEPLFNEGDTIVMKVKRENLLQRNGHQTGKEHHDVKKTEDIASRTPKPSSPSGKDEKLSFAFKQENFFQGHKQEICAENVSEKSEDCASRTLKQSSSSKRVESIHNGNGLENRENAVPSGEPEITSVTNHSKSGDKDRFSGNNLGAGSEYAKLTRSIREEEAARLKPFFNNGLPPPYVKPNGKARNITEMAEVETRPDVDKTVSAPKRANDHDNVKDNALPKPRSSRRRHHKTPSHDEIADTEDPRIMKRRMRSRRKERSGKGFRTSFDDDDNEKDDEEMMIDKLLMHYSRKPSSYDEMRMQQEESNSSRVSHPEQGGSDAMSEIPPPTRSFSLPNKQSEPSESGKVFSRAASFQSDRSSSAKHVHPKLPDYDDLAARFAALKGR